MRITVGFVKEAWWFGVHITNVNPQKVITIFPFPCIRINIHICEKRRVRNG